MKFNTKVAAVLGVAALVMPLAACGGAGANDENTITFFANNTQDAYEPLIEGFEKANPDIKIEFTTTTGAQAGYQQTLQTRISGGQLTDVFVMPPEQMSDLVKNKIVMDLSDMSFISKLTESNKDTYSVDGKLYGMSLSSWNNAYAYNKDLLAKAGYDTIPETWDEFIQMLKDLKDAGVEKPYLEPKAGLGAPVEAWIGFDSSKQDKSIDQQITDGETTFTKSYTKYYDEWQKLITEGVMGSEVSGLADDQVRTEFTAGRLAVMPSGAWDISTFNDAGLNYSFGRIPMLHKGDTPWAPGSADPSYAINAKLTGKKLENVKKLFEYMTSDEGLKAYQKGTGGIPSIQGVEPEVDEHFKEAYDLYVKTGNVYLQTLDWPESGRSALRAECFAQLQQVALGSITPQQASENLDAKLATLS